METKKETRRTWGSDGPSDQVLESRLSISTEASLPSRERPPEMDNSYYNCFFLTNKICADKNNNRVSYSVVFFPYTWYRVS